MHPAISAGLVLLTAVVAALVTGYVTRRNRLTDLRADTYVELLQLLNHRQEECNRLSYGGDPEPDLDKERIEVMVARLRLFASAETFRAVQQFLTSYGQGTLPSMFSNLTAAHGGVNYPARLELGRIAEDLARQLDVIADCMRHDVGLRRVFVKMRQRAAARDTPEAQIAAMDAAAARRAPIVAANRFAASRAPHDETPAEPLPEEDHPAATEAPGPQ